MGLDLNQVVSGGFLQGKKTYVVAVLFILSSVGGYLVGDVNLVGLLQDVLGASGLAALRHGVAKP